MKDKIRITLTMTDEQAWWLWEHLMNVDEDTPWYPFFSHVADVIDRARTRYAERAAQLAAAPDAPAGRR